jgi:hypothetical protein
MDLGNIVYILAVIGYFIYQATQNKKKKQRQMDASGTPPEEEERPVSFEDLLKEIRQAQSPKPVQQTQIPTPQPQKPSRGFESTYEKPKSDSSYHKPESTYTQRESTYQKPVSSYEKPASTYEKQKSWYDKNDDDEITYYEGAYEEKVRSKISDSGKSPEIPTLEIERGDVKSGKVNPYAQMLKNPKSVRDAIVLNEILTKKYF